MHLIRRRRRQQWFSIRGISRVPYNSTRDNLEFDNANDGGKVARIDYADYTERSYRRGRPIFVRTVCVRVYVYIARVDPHTTRRIEFKR